MTDKKNEKPAEEVPKFQQSLEELRKQDAPRILEKIDRERKVRQPSQQNGCGIRTGWRRRICGRSPCQGRSG